MGAILEWFARHTLSVSYRGRLLEDDAGGACATSVADSWESASPLSLILFFSSSSHQLVCALDHPPVAAASRDFRSRWSV